MIGLGIVFQREARAFFTSPVIYLITTAMLVMTGFFFTRDLTVSLTVKPADPAIVPNFLSLAMIFFAPLLTMRLLAEEKREGTIELLLTAPVQDNAIVFGKFLGAWFYFTVVLAITLVYQTILANITTPDFGLTVAAYLGIWLYGGATLAIGMMFSAFTESQVVSAFLSMTVLAFLYIGDFAGQVVGSVELARIIRTLSFQGHFSTSFAFGLLRLEDVAYFAGIIVVALYVTVRVVESQRWR